MKASMKEVQRKRRKPPHKNSYPPLSQKKSLFSIFKCVRLRHVYVAMLCLVVLSSARGEGSDIRKLRSSVKMSVEMCVKVCECMCVCV